MTSFRDTVMDTLLARLKDACGDSFKYYSRRFWTWEQMLASRQQGDSPISLPALFLYDGVGLGGGVDKVEPRGRASPSVITMKRTIVIYAEYPGTGTPGGPSSEPGPGSTPFNDLVETILNDGFANDSASQNACTLSTPDNKAAYPTGLVSHCWVEGDILYITPDIDPTGLGMVGIPISVMLYPNSA